MKVGWGAWTIVALAAAAPASTRAAPDPAVEYANSVKAGALDYREGWFGEGNARLHYVEAGTGPLILFYHGFPSF